METIQRTAFFGISSLSTLPCTLLYLTQAPTREQGRTPLLSICQTGHCLPSQHNETFFISKALKRIQMGCLQSKPKAYGAGGGTRPPRSKPAHKRKSGGAIFASGSAGPGCDSGGGGGDGGGGGGDGGGGGGGCGGGGCGGGC